MRERSLALQGQVWACGAEVRTAGAGGLGAPSRQSAASKGPGWGGQGRLHGGHLTPTWSYRRVLVIPLLQVRKLRQREATEL